MTEYVQTPIFNSVHGWLTILFLIGINGVLAFLSLVSFRLRTKGWQVVCLASLMYVAINLLIPSYSVRNYLQGSPTPPADMIRSGSLFLSLAFGLYGIWYWMHQGRR